MIATSMEDSNGSTAPKMQHLQLMKGDRKGPGEDILQVAHILLLRVE